MLSNYLIYKQYHRIKFGQASNYLNSVLQIPILFKDNISNFCSEFSEILA